MTIKNRHYSNNVPTDYKPETLQTELTCLVNLSVLRAKHMCIAFMHWPSGTNSKRVSPSLNNYS